MQFSRQTTQHNDNVFSRQHQQQNSQDESQTTAADEETKQPTSETKNNTAVKREDMKLKYALFISNREQAIHLEKQKKVQDRHRGKFLILFGFCD